MIEEFNSWVMYLFMEFSKIKTLNAKFKIRWSVYMFYFLISYK